jgi:hypothetical protein
MKRILIACALLAACTSMQVTTPGSVSIVGADQDRAFSAALQAALQANLTVKNSDRATGFIYATKGASSLTANAKELFLSVTVTADGDGATVIVRSVLPGQLTAMGATRKLLEQYCDAFARLEPTAVFEIDGKEYVP